jgi:hypothetical protein
MVAVTFPVTATIADITPGYFPSNIPACKEFKILGRRPQFDWPSIDMVGQEAEWLTYRCAEKPANLSAMYRKTMVTPPYDWLEMSWVVLPQGLLGTYLSRRLPMLQVPLVSSRPVLAGRDDTGGCQPTRPAFGPAMLPLKPCLNTARILVLATFWGIWLAGCSTAPAPSTSVPVTPMPSR